MKNMSKKRSKLTTLTEEECKALLKALKEKTSVDKEQKAFLLTLLSILKCYQVYVIEPLPRELAQYVAEHRELNLSKRGKEIAYNLSEELACLTKLYTGVDIKPERFLDIVFIWEFAKIIAASGIPNVEKYVLKWCGLFDLWLKKESLYASLRYTKRRGLRYLDLY